VPFLQIIVPILRILEKMHALTIMHRDIKPENIFLTKAGKFRLGDFGLALLFEEEIPFSRSGTLDYMAPEVCCHCHLPLLMPPCIYLGSLQCCPACLGPCRCWNNAGVQVSVACCLCERQRAGHAPSADGLVAADTGPSNPRCAQNWRGTPTHLQARGVMIAKLINLAWLAAWPGHCSVAGSRKRAAQRCGGPAARD
jgi:hypothetical protein